MQRFSISVDDDLAVWIESQADERGVSKAKVIRDAVETAKLTRPVNTGEDDTAEYESLVERIDDLEARLTDLESGSGLPSSDTDDGTENTTDDVVAAFRAQLEGRPPTTEHGQKAVVRVFELLLEDGPMETKELRETIYPEFEDEFGNPNSMWQSTQRHFEDLDGIEKVDYGKWDVDASSLDPNL